MERFKEIIIGSMILVTSIVIIITVWTLSFTKPLSYVRITSSILITMIFATMIPFAYRIVRRPREKILTLNEVKKKIKCRKDNSL